MSGDLSEVQNEDLGRRPKTPRNMFILAGEWLAFKRFLEIYKKESGEKPSTVKRKMKQT